MIKEFINLLFPQWCAGCMQTLASGEEWVCTACRSEMIISTTYKERPNIISSKFYGKIPVEHACTMFNFSRGGVTQNLLHRLKYEGYSELGIWLGNMFGSVIREQSWIDDIDYLVPIPLHKKKLSIRGYNQSESFARGLSEAIQKPLSNMLYRTRHTLTQTRKSRLDRWKNVSGVFELKKGISIQDANILLVDDVITSGATLEAAGNTLKENGAGSLYVGTIASA